MPPATPRSSNTGSSFLDEWLAKRQGTPTPASPHANPPSQANYFNASPPYRPPGNRFGQFTSSSQPTTPTPFTQPPTTKPSNHSAQPTPVNLPNNPTGAKPMSNSGEIRVRNNEENQSTDTTGDTIYIDKEGNFSSED